MANCAVYLSKPGIVCAAGLSLEQVWETALKGSNENLKKVSIPGGKTFYAGIIDDSKLSPVDYDYDMKSLRVEDAALNQIATDVEKVIQKYGADRIGVCIGSCDNGSSISVAAHKEFFESQKFPKDYDLAIQAASLPAEFASKKFGIKGPSLGFATACSSGGSALIKAAQYVKSGICDAVIAGGMDMAGEVVITGFNGLEAVSPEKTIPFSANRSGINLGDGAAFFIVTREPLEGGEEIQLLGYGESADADHMTAPKADGSGAAQAMNEALKKAALTADSIDYINLHGTGTHLNDSMEALGVKTVFPDRYEEIPVSSTKGIMGHTLGAAGAVEAALCWEVVAQKSKKLPVHVWDKVREETMPHLHFVEKDEECKNPAKICMSNSFAFGGCNVCLIIGKK